MRNSFSTYKITYILIAINFLGYLLSVILSQSVVDIDIEVLAKMGAIYGPATVLYNEWWRLISAMFLHGGMTHLLMNMFSLYLIGRGVEQYFNVKSYLSIYFISGIVGGLVSIIVHPISVGVGASGAIFGIFGALGGFFMAHREKIESHTRAFMKDFAMIIGINLILGFLIPSIDVSAHVAGLIVGFFGGYIISKNPRWLTLYVVIMVIVMMLLAYYLMGQYEKVL